MRIVIVLLECKAEGDRTDNEGLFQRWNWNRQLKLCIECDVLLVAKIRQFQICLGHYNARSDPLVQ